MKTLLYMVAAGLLFVFIITVGKDFIPQENVLSEWAQKQIEDDINVFAKNSKITSADVDREYKNLSSTNNSLLRFQIFNGKLYANYKNLDTSNDLLVTAYKTYYKFFTTMLDKYSADIRADFIIFVGDDLSVEEDYVSMIPVIAGVKNTNKPYSKYIPLAPDHYTISEWPRLYDDILSANHRYKWNEKISKAFWRGSTSGGIYTRTNWQDFPRVKLVELSKENPELLDAKFTALSQNDPEVVESINEKYPLALAVSQVDHVKYKTQIAIDGSSLSGYLWRLLSNSVVLKQQSTKIQWFFPILKTGEHYIDIAFDMSDVLDKIKWTIDNDLESKRIGDEGSKLIEKEIPPSHLYMYWSHLLREYSKLQDLSKAEPTLPKAEVIF